MKLYPDKPTSQGMENALKRARQMVDFRWTPIRPVPAGMPNLHVGGDKGCADCFLPALQPLAQRTRRFQAGSCQPQRP